MPAGFVTASNCMRFHCMSARAGSDLEVIDGLHAGEDVYLKIRIRLLRDGSALDQ